MARRHQGKVRRFESGGPGARRRTARPLLRRASGGADPSSLTYGPLGAGKAAQANASIFVHTTRARRLATRANGLDDGFVGSGTVTPRHDDAMKHAMLKT